MSRIKTVFMDMDDVLTAFSQKVAELLNIEKCFDDDPLFMEYEWIKRLGVRDRVEAFCDEEFWKSLDWTLYGKELLSMVEDIFDKENIYIVTKPMENPGSEAGKIQWIIKHIPHYRFRTFIGGIPKEFLAAPGRLLVDDKEENCERFFKAGGEVILVPHQWNMLRDRKDSVIDYVKLEIRRLLGE